jgi:glycosyltransferase involved in cell wall biosynthesis
VLNRAAAPGPLQIIFVGNLIPRKGLHTLLGALASLPPRDWLLTVVGSPDMDISYARAIRGQIATLGLTGRVSLLGTLSPPELAARLRQSHLLAVPSSYEGFGIVYLEAMRFGLPVIAGDAGGSREIVSPGVTGFLVPPGDSTALARGLASLLPNRDLLVRLSLAALDQAASHPTWEGSAAQVREFLDGFLSSRLKA